MELVRDVKSRTKYQRKQEIKRQSSNSRYRELSLEQFTKQSSEELVEEYAINNLDTAEYLNRFAKQAKKLGWRQDRVNNTIKVAIYAIKNGTLRASHEALGMDRHTVSARKKDLRLLQQMLP